MNEESLSALLDGECSPAELDEVLGAFGTDPKLRERYSRLRLARDARRGVRVSRARLDFADGVMAALDRQPAFETRDRRRWVMGLALAATVSALAVLVLRPQPPAAPAPVAAVPVPATITDWASLDAPSSRQLKAYLADYSRSRVQQGMAGTLQYARMAAYTVDPAAVTPVVQDVH